jgi:flagellar hook protein FlgE
MGTTFGLFNTSVMGMAAQSDALSTISENIANSSTTGYKKATTQFLTVLNTFGASNEFGGGVSTVNHYNVDTQGAIQNSSSSTDLAIKGQGFFVVSDPSGTIYLTRAGSFVADTQGRLVNSAGYYLMGFPGNAPASSSTNAVASMQLVKVTTAKLIAAPSTTGVLAANLPSNAAVITNPPPSANAAASEFTNKTSLTTYDNLGNSVVLDVYYAKTASNTWEMTVYDSADATSGGFPYANAPLGTTTLNFSATDGSLTSGSPLSVTVPNGGAVSLDLSNTTQLGAAFGVNNATVDGHAASPIKQVTISKDGTLSYQLSGGQSVAAYTIGLANVSAPSFLANATGNVYLPTSDSGQITVGAPQSGGLGAIQSSALEASAVDLATELSSMIVAQRTYTANSQAFQVASDVLQILNNLK